MVKPTHTKRTHMHTHTQIYPCLTEIQSAQNLPGNHTCVANPGQPTHPPTHQKIFP